MESSDQPFDVSNTPEYMKTYVNVMLSTLVDTIQTSTDAKTRMTLLDSICRQQKQQIDVLNDTVSQLTNGLQATSDEYRDLDSKCASSISQLTAELERAKEEIANRLSEVRALSSYEEKYSAVKKELEAVCNNYSATKTAYEELAKKYEELSTKYKSVLQEPKSSVNLPSANSVDVVVEQVNTKPPKKKQRSEDTGWD